ncbi:hypothetical protein [Micromonospora sp. WMMD964]|uniref:hypothetical protein n=1 Tax=Micromonospora sp. WMMD964 TaxID=3016091 RepID=UPI002499C484|nr:hypothetical protein [Micromonospora sp. WMMD964]WFF02170.1 hypothetical protein O7616_05230 [Micromonospora sp. WMMD964]
MPPFLDNGTRPKVWPSLPLALLLPCGLLILMGITDDREPPPPAGVLMPATVVAAEPAQNAYGPYVQVRVDTADGPTVCGIYAHSFPDGRLPAPHQRLTVDYTPERCMPEPVNTEMPRSVIVAMGATGLTASLFWLWAGARLQRFTRWWRSRP